MLKTTGIDMNAMYCGNPTCRYCGVTYPIMEQHNCIFGQEAMLKEERDKVESLLRQLKEQRGRLRDELAMAALPVTLQTYWDEVNRGRPVDPDWREGNAMEAYAMADAMLKIRNGAE